MAFKAPSKVAQSPVEEDGERVALRAMRRDAAAARDALTRLDTEISAALGESAPPKAKRGRHGANMRSKLDYDTEVKMFVEERLDTMTYNELAAAVRATFGPDRAIGRSSLQRWWTKKFGAAK